MVFEKKTLHLKANSNTPISIQGSNTGKIEEVSHA